MSAPAEMTLDDAWPDDLELLPDDEAAVDDLANAIKHLSDRLGWIRVRYLLKDLSERLPS